MTAFNPARRSPPPFGDVGRAEPEKIARSLLWQGAGTFVGQGLSWVATVIVIRLLAPSDYGLMAMANIPLGFLTLVCDLGVGAAAVQAVRIDAEQLRKLAGLTMVAGLGTGAILFAAASWLAEFFTEPRLVPVLRTLGIAFVLIASYTIPQALLIREFNFRVKATIDVIATALSALIALGLAVSGLGVWALVGGVLALHATKAVALNFVRPVFLRPALVVSGLAGLLRIGALVTLDRVLFCLLGSADMAVVGRALGKESLGIYAIAVTISTLPLEKVLPTIAQVSFAAFSRMQAEPERLQRNVVRGVRVVSLLLSPAFLGLAAVAPDLIPLLLGAKWEAAVVPMQLVCLVLPLRAVAALFQPALFGIGRPGVNVVNMAVTLVIMTAAFLVGVRHGTTGVALAWVAAYPVAFAIVVVRGTRALGVTAREVLAVALWPWLASGLMAAGVLALRSLLGDAVAPVFGVLVLILGGAAVYAIALWVLDRPAIEELRRLLRV